MRKNTETIFSFNFFLAPKLQLVCILWLIGRVHPVLRKQQYLISDPNFKQNLTRQPHLEAPLASADSFDMLDEGVHDDAEDPAESEIAVDPDPIELQAPDQSDQCDQNGSVLKNSFLLIPSFRLRSKKNSKGWGWRKRFKLNRQRKLSLALMHDALRKRTGVRSVFLSTHSRMEQWSVIDSWCAALFPLIFLIFNIAYWSRVWSIYSAALAEILESGT